MSRPYAEVIGDPIAHSKSPLIHNFWLGKLGIDAEYRACHVKPDELADYFARRREDATWRGCNVTTPHKEAVAPLIDAVDSKAMSIGAVNAVIRQPDGTLLGTNTDVDGVGEAIAGLELAGKTATVIGAGGAARAAFALLAGRQCESVRVIARNEEKALRAAQDCGLTVNVLPFHQGTGVLAGASLLINATQLGMSGQLQMPDFLLDEMAELASNALVFDMVYAPLETELLRAARKRGLRTSDGLAMLIGQAATAFTHFFGQPAPRQHETALRKLLTS